MPKRPKTARAVSPNAGVTAAYRRVMQTMIVEMHADVARAVSSEYRAGVVLVATDAKPVERIRKIMSGLADKWLKRFEDTAPKIATTYVKDIFKATDSAMRSSLRAAGWAVEFKMTPAVKDAFRASLDENVGLIRSIPEQYLGRVQDAVTRSYEAGQDLQALVADIKDIYGMTQTRAELIARDQSGKANSVTTRTRQEELGIVEAIWLHSHGGKHPRPDHVAANGTRYKIADGCLISGKYVQPGYEINCRCGSRPVLPF